MHIGGWEKYAAEELLKTGENFRFLAEALPEIIWTGEPDGTIDFMNSRWFEYTGLTEEETYGETKSAVHPDDLEEYRRRWQEAVKLQQPYEVEYRFRRASDGEYRWHLGRGLPIRDKAGKILKWFGTCTDIHDQKLAEEQVRRLNAELEQRVAERTADLEKEMHERMAIEERDRAKLDLLRIIIDTMPMAAAATDWRHSVLHANEAFRSLFAGDHSPSTLVDSDCLWLLRSAAQRFESPEEYLKTVAYLERQPSEQLRRELALQDGRMLMFEYLPISEGQYRRGHLLLIRDISQEGRINRAKTEFMSLASHQLRTPLTSVRWALNRLSRSLVAPSPADRELLERARGGIANMADTITTMLSISRIEAGKMPLRITDVELGGFLAEMLLPYRDAVKAKRQELVVESPSDVRFRADPRLLREVMENLLSNAIKYTPAGGRITVTALHGPEGVRISVKDTGYGIPLHQQKRVFTKFFRGENVMTVETEGTGLGLYLVAQLVELMGGTIGFESTPERGTEFLISLPAI